MAAASQVVKRIISPIEDFLRTETSSGIILMFVTAIAMIWANSPLHHTYENFIEYPLGFTVGHFVMVKTLHHWVNDGLMVIFFFVVGLEIKRELAQGELSTPKKAALPLFAALGGMIVPALIYSAFNHGDVGKSGWGIPMATDIAFAVGVLGLMSRKVPFALKIFLLALAIVDDLGAVLVIAFFYTDVIVKGALATAAMAFVLTYLFKSAGVRNILVYVILGVVAWFAVLKSGVHATIAGVVLGLMTPVSAFYHKLSIPEKLKQIADEIKAHIHANANESEELSHEAQKKIHELKSYATESISPLDRLVHTLHPWVSYVIMPLFALVNAGVRIEGITLDIFLDNNVALGVILGLLFGKPLGILLFSYIAVKLDLARLPRKVTWMHMVAVGFLAGIGFTMALFIAHLALGNVAGVEVFSKLGILTGSVLAGVVGSALLALSKEPSAQSEGSS